MDRREKVGRLKCRVCGQGFEYGPINYLHQPIDIFCEWIDELERDNQRGSDDDDEKSSSEEEDEHDRWEARNSRA